MNVSALGLSSAFFANSTARPSAAASAQPAKATAPGASFAGGALTQLSPQQAVQLSFDQIMALQSTDADAPTTPTLSPPSVEDLFLEEARKSPMERMREQILASLGYTEDSLSHLPADERAAVEDKIKTLIQEKFREAMGADKSTAGDAAAELNGLI